MTEKEIWKTYPEFTFVEVSSFGNVRIVDHYVTDKNGKKYHRKGHALKQYPNPSGYMYVKFKVNNKTVHRSVHRMVAVTFIPNPDNLPEVNHIDNNRTNNTVNNLEWCTRQYNEAYKKNFGTSAAETLGRPVIAINLDNFKVMWFKSQSEAGRQLVVDVGNLNRVIRCRYTQTGNQWFCYADLNAVEKTKSKFGDEIAAKVEKLIRDHL